MHSNREMKSGRVNLKRERERERERELREELRAREKAFISYQLKRESKLLKIMKEREDAMEKNMMQKAAFGYLYKEHQKEIKLLIEKKIRRYRRPSTTEKSHGQKV